MTTEAIQVLVVTSHGIDIDHNDLTTTLITLTESILIPRYPTLLRDMLV